MGNERKEEKGSIRNMKTRKLVEEIEAAINERGRGEKEEGTK